MPLPRPTLRRKPLPQQAATAPAAVTRNRLAAQARRIASHPGFEQRLSAPVRKSKGSPAKVAVMALGGGLGAAGMFVGWLQSSVLLGAGGLAAACIAAGLAWKSRSVTPHDAVSANRIDLDAARRLDLLIDECAAELPAPAVKALTDIAGALGRITPQLRAGPPGPPWRPEDDFFLGELLRRYVPDSLQHYLRIPAAQRASPVLDDGRTPEAALTAQLDGLRQELAERESRLAQSSAQALALQGAFLEARRKD